MVPVQVLAGQANICSMCPCGVSASINTEVDQRKEPLERTESSHC